METRRVLGKAGEDGTVHLDLEFGTPRREYEMIMVAQAIPGGQGSPPMTQAEWAAFIEATAGSIEDESFRRDGQCGSDDRAGA